MKDFAKYHKVFESGMIDLGLILDHIWYYERKTNLQTSRSHPVHQKWINLLITGQAGVGKSQVVNAIRKDCKQHGLEVAVVC